MATKTAGRVRPYLEPCGSRYGAPMGRASTSLPARFAVARVPLRDGGYDAGGAYWGVGAPLWCGWAGDRAAYVRAPDLDAARVQLEALA